MTNFTSNLNIDLGMMLSILLVLGIIWCFLPSFEYCLKESLSKKKTATKARNLRHSSGNIQDHLRQIFNSIYDEKTNIDKKMKNFYTTTFIFFFASFVILFQVLRVKAFFFAIVFGALPYIWIRYRLAKLQRMGSFDGEFIIKELRNQYRYNYNNMIVALDRTIDGLGQDHDFSRRILFKLSLRLKTYQSAEDLIVILNDFVFAYNTRWALMLSNNIYNAVEEHADVTAGLEELLGTCKRINVKIQKEKQANMQTVTMNKILSPILFVLFYVIACSMIGAETVVRVQFTTELGLMLFIALILLTLANFVVGDFASKTKYDI